MEADLKLKWSVKTHTMDREADNVKTADIVKALLQKVPIGK
jgi:hypothetical protein